MKKIIALVFVLCMMVSAVAVNADAIRDNALGNPIMNVNDTAVMQRYPAALQQFPNVIYAIFDGNAANNYKNFGVGYKASDMFGLKIGYEFAPTTFNFDYVEDIAILQTVSMAQVSSIVYGMKMGTMFGGFSAKTYFFNGELLDTTTYRTNKEFFGKSGVSGFMTTFAPSVIMDVAGMTMYGTIDLGLDFTKRYVIRTNTKTQYRWESGAPVKTLQVNLLGVKKMSDTASMGLEVKFLSRNDGYNFQDVTNGKDTFVTNAYVGGAIAGSLGIGSSVKPTDSVTVFFDMTTSFTQTTPLHKKDADKLGYNITTVWMIPSFNLGAEFELIKDLKLRISANPSYSITTVKKATYETVSFGNFTTTAGTFAVNSAVGLGYKVGSFAINWKLAPAFLQQVLTKPNSYVNINGVGGWAVNLASDVQVSYTF